MTDNWLINYWTTRANLSQMTEAQLLELADYLRPYANDVDVFLMWSAALLATEE